MASCIIERDNNRSFCLMLNFHNLLQGAQSHTPSYNTELSPCLIYAILNAPASYINYICTYVKRAIYIGQLRSWQLAVRFYIVYEMLAVYLPQLHLWYLPRRRWVKHHYGLRWTLLNRGHIWIDQGIKILGLTSLSCIIIQTTYPIQNNDIIHKSSLQPNHNCVRLQNLRKNLTMKIGWTLVMVWSFFSTTAM